MVDEGRKGWDRQKPGVNGSTALGGKELGRTTDMHWEDTKVGLAMVFTQFISFASSESDPNKSVDVLRRRQVRDLFPLLAASMSVLPQVSSA